MTPVQFYYWLSGSLQMLHSGLPERGESRLTGISLNAEQVSLIMTMLRSVKVEEKKDLDEVEGVET